MSAAVLSTNGIAFGQDAVTASGGSVGAPAYDWLSPAPMAWNPTAFNWADLPLTLYVHESGGYNSNIYNVSQYNPAQGAFLPVVGDSFLRTDVGASTKINIESQQLFVDLTQSTTNYHHYISQDIHNYSFDGGINWKSGSRCDGKLIATNSLTQSIQELSAATGVDNLKTQALSETGQCHFYQDIGVIFNADAISTRHSLISTQSLNNNTTDLQGGLQYQWASLDNIQALIKYTNTYYTDRAATSIYGTLPPYVHLLNYGLTYNNTASQVFDFSVMFGFTESLGLMSASKNLSDGPLQPVYSVSVNYHPSPKWGLSLASSRLVSPPSTLVTNAATQTTTSQTASFNYAWTPKLSLSASLGLSTSKTPGTTTVASGYGLYGANTYYNATFGATYIITPFTSLVLSLNRSVRQANGTSTTFGNGAINTTLMTIGLDYRPH